MEENDDIIYDLEAASGATHAEGVSHAEGAEGHEGQRESEGSGATHAEGAEVLGAQRESEEAAISESSGSSGSSEGSDNHDNHDNPDNPDNQDPARAKIEKMVEEMGAETLLDIIRDNRNAAIRQIIREVEATQDRTIPSGFSVAKKCGSIFDLAALA